MPPEILLIPLAGHTWGHSGVAIKEDDGRWLLHAGDAYSYRGEVGSARYSCPPGMRGYQRMMEVDRHARLSNQAKLRRLSLDHDDEVRIFCAHDPVEFGTWRAWSTARWRPDLPNRPSFQLPLE